MTLSNILSTPRMYGACTALCKAVGRAVPRRDHPVPAPAWGIQDVPGVACTLSSGGQHVAAAEFTGAAVPLPRPATGACAFPGCSYEISGDGLCDGHRYRWSRVGRPPMDRLPTELASRTVPGFSVSGMGPLAALEFQYLLQLRTDQRRSKIYPSAWTRTVITFLQEGVSVAISPATIDRRLAADRAAMTLRGRSHAKPGSLLKNATHHLSPCTPTAGSEHCSPGRRRPWNAAEMGQEPRPRRFRGPLQGARLLEQVGGARDNRQTVSYTH